MSWSLFTDGSSDPKSKIGYGCFLLLESPPLGDCDNLADLVRTKRFYPTSSSRLELQCVIWALESISLHVGPMTLYTDSQVICGLSERRARLEKARFCGKNGKELAQADLYLKFYYLSDALSFTVKKIKGHRPNRESSDLDRIFKIVDKATRAALRKELS
ncbi:ribonuclease HI [Pelagicoccus albus]|uniref:Ribonuclease H n=1 Tax=Pelagicoccus albus TaxID=415222 RepID=A0A7X1E8N1_9BACT|nr:RNase H family protein [Pelagicoccus albus]MBC2604957.1 ribonuclease H [Pelagicoccus albus]